MYIDLLDLQHTESVGGKKYTLVCVDDYSWYTWIGFLMNKPNDTFGAFRRICLNIHIKKGSTLKRLRSDHGQEFENNMFFLFFRSI